MTGALGAGMCVWSQTFADVDESAWRALYVLPLLFLPVICVVGRRLPESRRFEVTHVDVPIAGHGRRFWLLATSLFLLAVFAAPASQVTNDFLRDERGFSSARVTLFVILTSTPGAIGIIVGGRLADVRGRRVVGAVGITGGTLLTVASYYAHGWPLWALVDRGIDARRPHRAGDQRVPAGAVPDVAAGPCQWPDRGDRRVRQRARPALHRLASPTGGAATPARSPSSPSPSLAVAVLMLVAFPETARRSLEDLNPEDAGSDRRSHATTVTAATMAPSAPCRSWPLPSIHTWVTAPGIAFVCAVSSSGVPNASRVPDTNRHGTRRARGKWSTRSCSGRPGGWSG